MNTLITLADFSLRTGGSDNGFINALLTLLVIGVCVGLIWAFGRWIIQKFAAPPAVMVCRNGLFLFLGLIFVINFLVSLTGHPFIRL